jgi:hypothetical protein
MGTQEKEDLIRLAVETMKMCKIVIENMSTEEPKLIGLVKASEMVSRSRVWLRRKLERGELTGYQSGKGGAWQIEPSVLLKELKQGLKVSKPVRRIQSKLYSGQ